MVRLGPYQVADGDAILVAWVPLLLALGRRWLLWWDRQGPPAKVPAVFAPTDGEDGASTEAPPTGQG